MNPEQMKQILDVCIALSSHRDREALLFYILDSTWSKKKSLIYLIVCLDIILTFQLLTKAYFIFTFLIALCMAMIYFAYFLYQNRNAGDILFYMDGDQFSCRIEGNTYFFCMDDLQEVWIREPTWLEGVINDYYDQGELDMTFIMKPGHQASTINKKYCIYGDGTQNELSTLKVSDMGMNLEDFRRVHYLIQSTFRKCQ